MDFLNFHHRCLCAECGFSYDKRFSVCRRSLGPGRPRCRDVMMDPHLSSWIEIKGCVQCPSVSQFQSLPPHSQADNLCDQAFITLQTVGVSSCSDLVLEGIRAAATLVSPVDNESAIFSAVMNEIMTLHVDTVSHIPRSVRPLLAQVLAVKLRHACSGGLWGFVRFFLFAKAVLRLPHRGGRKRDLSSTLC